MGHNPRKMKWTKAYRKTHGKELMYDKKRNVAAIDRLLVDKADYIKNKEVRDKYRTRANEKLKAEVAAIESKKSKLQQELLAGVTMRKKKKMTTLAAVWKKKIWTTSKPKWSESRKLGRKK